MKDNYLSKERVLRMNILSYCDGKYSVFDIAKKCNVNLKLVNDELKILLSHKLVK